MLYPQEQVSDYLPVGIRRAVRPSVTARAMSAVRGADRLVTKVQDWLQQDDTAGQLIIVYAMIILAAGYFLAAVVRAL